MQTFSIDESQSSQKTMELFFETDEAKSDKKIKKVTESINSEQAVEELQKNLP